MESAHSGSNVGRLEERAQAGGGDPKARCRPGGLEISRGGGSGCEGRFCHETLLAGLTNGFVVEPARLKKWNGSRVGAVIRPRREAGVPALAGESPASISAMKDLRASIRDSLEQP